MINPKYSMVLAIPLILSGCVIIDADDADVRNVAVIHEVGEDTEAVQQAKSECGVYGLDAKLIDIDGAAGGGQVRSLFVCY